MPLALIFTSAPQGLSPGRSGFCTVARHADIPDRLVTMLEGLGTPHAAAGSATYTLRRLEAAGKGWHILSRFTAGGLDHTHRDNRLAHHLVFPESEVAALPPPADIAHRFGGWISEWSGPPNWLEPINLRLSAGRPLVPCSTWRRTTGTGAKAAWLVREDSPARACLTNATDTALLLELLAESSALLGEAAWSATFTTDASVSGAEDFAWCGGEVAGRQRIDLASAASEPAPDNAKARQAALGVATRPAPRTQTASVQHESQPSGSRLMPWIIGMTLLAAVAGAGLLALRRPKPEAPTLPTPPAQRAPSPQEMAAAAALLRANDALRDLQEIVGRGDLVTAARQWTEISRLSPEFTTRHRDQFVPRIQAGIAAAAADALDRQLSAPGVAEDPRALERLQTEARESIRIAADFGAPKDASWRRLAEMESRVRLLSQLDIRDTWLATGQWVTASAGPNIPSTADFELGKESGEAIARFLREGLTGGAGTSTPVTVRLCEFRTLAHRDTTSRPLRARLEPGANSLWVTEETGGARRPAITLSVGSRANTVSVNFTGAIPAGFTDTNRAVEVTNAAGKRLCIALIARPDAIEPVRLAVGGLSTDASMQATGPAPWIEPVFNRVRMAGGRIGLYPACREFPERSASLTYGRNLIDTDLIRLSAGNAGAPRAEVAERRRLYETGDLIGAGSPWTIRFVDARGQPLVTLAEFR